MPRYAPTALVALHVALVAGAVFSLLVLIPHPELWQHLPGSAQAFDVALRYAGSAHILAGAAAMVTVAAARWGWRASLPFLLIAGPLSLGMELLGTGTGWPFGNYSYTWGLGYKIAGRVPYSIPFSWYYLCHAAWILARGTLNRLGSSGRLAEVALTTWLLTAWDLVLDPAMAHVDQRFAFWQWHTRGAWLGMPLINLAGWMATGAIIVAAYRRVEPALDLPDPTTARLAAAVYFANLAFGAVLCVAAGLWLPVAAVLVAGVLPTLPGLGRARDAVSPPVA
jgi:putative membrane protein